MKKITFLFILFFVFVFALPVKVISQPVFPGDDEIFRDDVVARIDITIDPDTLIWLYQYQNLESDIEWHATFVFNNGSIHDTIENIGFRLRGNTSRYAAKKSFKVSFNTYESGRSYHGLEKMNLNGEHNDPSVSRSKLCWDLSRWLEIPASRSSHVRVYINNSYYGLYINVEHIDEEFVKSRFDNQNGNLYKCLWPADLDYLGDDPDLYKFESGGRRAYELKTNESLDDYSDLAHFIDVLNNTPDDELECEIEKVFNVQDYMKIVAMDVFTGNWDDYIYNKNNYYLYLNTSTGKFEFIPYDMDNTLGVDWMSIDWATRNIYNWANSGESRPLFERLMDVQKYHDWFSWYVSLIAEKMQNPDYFSRLDSIRDMIYPYVQNDPYYALDYGYTSDDFLDSWESFNSGHVKYGIKDYLNTRAASAQQQLDLNNISPVVNYLSLEHQGAGNPVTFRVFVFDDDDNPLVKLHYQLNGSAWEDLEMEAQENHAFVASLTAAAGETQLIYQVLAEDINGNLTAYPCEPDTLIILPGGDYQLFINEFLAGNVNGITDEAGEHDDWMEIYNAGSEAVWLGDKYLSDNLSNKDKWQFPDYTIQPEEFLLIWCDEDQDQGVFHTNFKISKGGEELGIFDNESSGFAVIDEIVFGQQSDDVSYGRDPDAGPDWIFYQDPTPGISNMLSNLVESPDEGLSFRAFPNPVSESWITLSKAGNFRVYTTDGRMVLSVFNTNRIYTGGLEKGLYLLQSDQGYVFKIIRN